MCTYASLNFQIFDSGLQTFIYGVQIQVEIKGLGDKNWMIGSWNQSDQLYRCNFLCSHIHQILTKFFSAQNCNHTTVLLQGLKNDQIICLEVFINSFV